MPKLNLNDFIQILSEDDIAKIERFLPGTPEDFNYSSGLWILWEDINYLWKEKQKAVFLYTLYRLLETKLACLGCNHRLLNISPEEAVQSFIDRWPPDEYIDDTMIICYIVNRCKKNMEEGEKSQDFDITEYVDVGEGWEERLVAYWSIGDLVWIYPDGELSWSMDAMDMPEPKPIEELPWIKAAQQS